VLFVGLMAVMLVSAALVGYYGQIEQTVTITQGVEFTGPGGTCTDNICTETGVSLSACESLESEEYKVDSSTSAVVPLDVSTVVVSVGGDENGVDVSTEFLLKADEIIYGAEGYTGADFAAGREHVTILTPGMILDDLDSLVFEQMVLNGYPASVNILLDVNGDGVFDSKKDLTDGLLTGGDDDVLKIEWAHNPASHGARGAPYTIAGDYNRWFNVFDEVSVIDGDASAWLYSEAPGPGVPDCNFNSATLADWKLGRSRGAKCCSVMNGWTAVDCDAMTVDSNTLVYGIQIESLGWIAASKSKVRNVKINGGSVEQPSLLANDDLRFKTLTEVNCLTVPDTYTLTTTVNAA